MPGRPGVSKGWDTGNSVPQIGACALPVGK